MPFKKIKRTDKDKACARNIVHREREIDQYQDNIDNHKESLKTLPTDWPPELEKKFRHLNPKQFNEALARGDVPEADFEQVSILRHTDRIRFLSKTERIEQIKSEHIYNAQLQILKTAKMADPLIADEAAADTAINGLLDAAVIELDAEIAASKV